MGQFQLTFIGVAEEGFLGDANCVEIYQSPCCLNNKLTLNLSKNNIRGVGRC